MAKSAEVVAQEANTKAIAAQTTAINSNAKAVAANTTALNANRLAVASIEKLLITVNTNMVALADILKGGVDGGAV
jgi:hypothetical protein